MARNRYSNGHCLKSLARDGDKAGRRGGGSGAGSSAVMHSRLGSGTDIAQAIASARPMRRANARHATLFEGRDLRGSAYPNDRIRPSDTGPP